MKTILVVDDEPEVAKALRRLMRKHFNVEIAHNGADALKRLEQSPVDLVLSDFRMPGMTGSELLSEVRRRWPTTLRLILSGFADLDSVLASVNEGEICRFLKKPWNDDELLATLRKALAAQDMMLALYQPFRNPAPGASVETGQDEGVARVSVRMAGAAFDKPLALTLLRKFLGAIEESDVALVGGLLEQNAGRLSVTVEVGGEQRLTLEVPVKDEAQPEPGHVDPS